MPYANEGVLNLVGYLNQSAMVCVKFYLKMSKV